MENTIEIYTRIFISITFIFTSHSFAGLAPAPSSEKNRTHKRAMNQKNESDSPPSLLHLDDFDSTLSFSFFSALIYLSLVLSLVAALT